MKVLISRYKCCLLLIILFLVNSNAQKKRTIKGIFPSCDSKNISLKGFNLKGDVLLSKSRINCKGIFVIKYPSSYVGSGVLQINEKIIPLILDQEDFEIICKDLNNLKSLKFSNSAANQFLYNAKTLYWNEQMKIDSLKFQLANYDNDLQKKTNIGKQIADAQNALMRFIISVPVKHYARYYLGVWLLLEDMKHVGETMSNTNDINTFENSFKYFFFDFSKLKYSGLAQSLLETYVIQIEPRSINDAELLNDFTDEIFHSLQGDFVLRNEISQLLFMIYEKRKYATAAKYLALKVLNNSDSFKLNAKDKALFSRYRID